MGISRDASPKEAKHARWETRETRELASYARVRSRKTLVTQGSGVVLLHLPAGTLKASLKEGQAGFFPSFNLETAKGAWHVP